jgi:hypothetical protein|tara:strand:- start:474 stop:695 length:222 start_codon:yes stop_codon:yes gene_type:complete
MKRLNYSIQVGEKYLNRSGVEMHVIKQVKDKFLATNPDGIYDAKDYGNGYFVNINGGFGNTTNHRDLIKKLNK